MIHINVDLNDRQCMLRQKFIIDIFMDCNNFFYYHEDILQLWYFS